MEELNVNRKKGTIPVKPGLFTAMVMGTFTSWSQTSADAAAAPASGADYSLAYILVAVVVMFVFIIGFLSKLLENVSDYFVDKWKKDNRKESANTNKTLMLGFLMLASLQGFAGNGAQADSGLIGGIPYLLFYILVSIIILEFTVVLVLTWQIWRFIQSRNVQEPATEEERIQATIEAQNKLSWWDRFNSFRPMAREADLDMGHDYDGIRELDNKLPPWWLYGFYLTIIAGVIYLYRYHVSHTGMSSEQEYIASVEAAAKSKEAYLKKAPASVDENTVVLITDPAQLAAGEANYQQLCAVCHGKKGEGLVGPNLTDDYWLYGGGVKDIFKTIKYGTNKGMQSWKENLNGDKMAQIVGYIKTLHGTNPPNAKPPAGDLYKEATETAAAPVKDSTTAK